MTAEKNFNHDIVKQLKDLGDVLEKLRIRRKEIKSQLAKELKEREEEEFASELDKTSKAIARLDAERLKVIDGLAKLSYKPVP